MELEPGERGQRGREHQRSRRIGLLGFGELGRREFEDDQAFIEMIIDDQAFIIRTHY